MFNKCLLVIAVLITCSSILGSVDDSTRSAAKKRFLDFIHTRNTRLTKVACGREAAAVFVNFFVRQADAEVDQALGNLTDDAVVNGMLEVLRSMDTIDLTKFNRKYATKIQQIMIDRSKYDAERRKKEEAALPQPSAPKLDSIEDSLPSVPGGPRYGQVLSMQEMDASLAADRNASRQAQQQPIAGGDNLYPRRLVYHPLGARQANAQNDVVQPQQAVAAKPENTAGFFTPRKLALAVAALAAAAYVAS